ncbi:GspE/PulE family protein [Paenibacillus koleovorans]|uniref:GspE/PulE family protein n=1 Tax=Paenibacillus koleovorans TaxID=121608 RepID=UPI000FD8DC03|nr:GspE/PulE family protein [Paenibacillus koleovorans]
MAVRKRIGDLLLEAGMISEEQLQRALKEQKELKLKLGELLITRNYITEQQMIEVLEFQLGIPHVQLYKQTIEPKVLAMIPQRLAEQHQVFPVRIDGSKLFLAMSDPLDYYAIDELRMATGMRIEPVIASKDELTRAIKRFYSLQDSIEQINRNLQPQAEETKQAQPEDESPVVKTVNQIIIQAVQIGASDIHIDPQEDELRIRYRVDGMMRTERTLPANMQSVIVARVKIMGNMNVAERRLPQDGRLEMEIDFRKIDVRISTLPTIHGEKVVLRILDLGATLTSFEQLGLSEHNMRLFLKGIAQTSGIIFITGPTGSGKTTTLYSALSRLNKDDVNIITIEDPVEYQLQGINQVQVNTVSGLTFARGLRSILRQDPNIVMVGEIRDVETAEIAVRAAMTGHLVLSTLHSNSAVNSISRLIDMGVEPFLVASSISCIVAQRLVRRICPNCSVPHTPTQEETDLLRAHGLSTEKMRKGTGCERCGRTGYHGRLALHEIMDVDSTMRTMIMQKKEDGEYERYGATIGLVPLFEDGLQKVAAGQTTVHEIYRILGLDC